jgi:HEPN domain-containing protein
MSIQNIIDYWNTGSQEALEIVHDLYNSKKFHYSLFFCHLALEKLLKALILQKTQEPPPSIHDLIRLAESGKITLTDTQKDDFDEINGFNLKARYDDYKLSFYKKATKDYADIWITKTKEYIEWLKKQ